MNGEKTYINGINGKIDRLLEKNSDKGYLKGYRYFLIGMAPSSIYNYISRVNHFMDSTQKEPEDLRLDDYTIYLGEIADRTSSYRIVTHTALRKFSLYLKANDINTLDPMQYISRPKAKESIETKEKRVKGFLEKKEIKTIKKNIEFGVGSLRARHIQEKSYERDMAIFMIFLNTGMRCSALCKLDVDNIDKESKSIVVTDKGSKVMRYNLAEETWDCLSEWLYKREYMVDSDEEALFISRSNERMGYRSIYNLVKKYSEGIKGKNITPHKLRATYGTQLYNATKDIKFVQKCMNHSNPQTTMLYIRGDENKTKEASEIMSKLISG